jgi:hypothetical protein
MTKKTQIRIAVTATTVGLAAAGAAMAATKLHSSHGSAANAGLGSFISAGASSNAPAVHFGGRGGPHGDDLAAAATYLGLTQAALQTQLQSGKTLAQVANATSGKSEAGLIDALVAAEKAELAQEVKDGHLTQARADQLTAALPARTKQQVESTHPAGGPGHGPGGGRGDDLAAAATYLGITQAALQTQLESGKTLAQIANATSGKSEAGLIDALVAAEKAELAQAVKDGKLTQAQADQLTAGLQARFKQQVESTRPAGGPGPGFGHGHGPGDDLQAAATYLGTTVDALVTQLQSGKTLAQIANATSGKSAAGLVDALVAAEKAELAQAVKDGELTQAQADQLATGLTARATAQVNGTGFPGGHDGPGGHDDHGFGGPAPGSSTQATPSSGTHI